MHPDRKTTFVGFFAGAATWLADYVATGQPFSLRGIVTALGFAVLGKYSAGQVK